MTNSDKKLELTQKVIIYALFLLAVAGLIIPLIFGQSNLFLLGSYLAIPMLMTPILYIYFKNHQIPYKSKNLNKNNLELYLTLYLICLLFSLFLLYSYDIRPYSYYITITFMALLILFEIFHLCFSKKTSIIVLLQIMILATNIIWSASLKYYFFIGRTDPFAHVWFIENLINSGYVSDIFRIYSAFPLWHILCSIIYETINIQMPLHKVVFFIGGIFAALLILAVYSLSFKLFKKTEIALLVALFVCIYPDFIIMGMSSLPRSPIMFLEVLLILLLLDSHDTKKTFLAITLTFAVISYHPASIPFIMFIFLILYVLENFYGVCYKSKFLAPRYILISASMTIAYWMYYSKEMFSNFIEYISAEPPTGILTKSVIEVPVNELLNYIQLSPLLIFIILGILIGLNSIKFSEMTKMFFITAILLIPISFPGPILLLNKISGQFNFDRFGEYAFIFICIAAAIGLNEFYLHSKKPLRIFAIMLFAVMCFLSISNDFTATDNPIVKRPFYTYYLTEEETIALKHVADITTFAAGKNKNYLMSDFVSQKYLEFSLYEPISHILMVDKTNLTFLRNSNEDIILIREKELTKRPLKLFSSDKGKFSSEGFYKVASYEYYYNDLTLWKSVGRNNRLFDSGGVIAIN